MVYEDPAILLYLTTEADYPTCGSDNPGDTCEYEAAAFQEGECYSIETEVTAQFSSKQ